MFNIRFWVFISFFGLIVQIIGFILFGTSSINHLTPFVVYTNLWIISILLIKYFFKKKPERKLNYTILSTSIFVTICILEFALRFFGVTALRTEKRLLGRYMSPYRTNQRYWIDKRTYNFYLTSPEFKYYRKLNNEGFSDKNWDFDKIKHKYRILTLGDSFTEGDGADADSTWQRFLERKLNDTSIFIMNAGVCGSDPVFEYYLLTHRLIKYKPHLVIITINHSDIFDIAIRGGFERFQGNEVVFKKAPWWEPIYAISFISRLIFRLRYDSNLLDKNKKFDYGYYSSLIIAESIKKFLDFGKYHSVKFLFVFTPGQGELKKRIHLWKILVKKLEKNRIPVCDLYQYYLQQNVTNHLSEYYWTIDGHHNAAGYKLMSEGILQAIKQYSLFPEKNETVFKKI